MSDPKSFRKVSSIYQETRYTEGLETHLYNVFFMIQRLIYAWTIVYLYDAPYIQVALTSVVSYGMLLYLISFKPFENRVNNIVTIFTEACVFITISGLGAFLLDRVEGRIREIVGYSLGSLVVVAVSVPVIVAVVRATKSLLEKCKKKDPQMVFPVERTEDVVVCTQQVNSK